MSEIKVTVEEKKVEKKSEYPCFKISTSNSYPPNQVVFFTKESEGYYIAGDPIRKNVYFSNGWCEDRFIPFHGTITIEVE